MSTTSLEVRTAPLIQIKFSSASPNSRMGLAEFAEVVDGLEMLVRLSYAASEVEEDGSPGRAEVVATQALYGTSLPVWLARVTYNSPLEIILIIGASSAVAASTASRVVRILRDWQAFRSERARAALVETVMTYLRQQIESLPVELEEGEFASIAQALERVIEVDRLD